MNYARLALAAVAATIFDAVYGFLVYGMLLVPDFSRYPAVYRSNEAGMAYLPLMFARPPVSTRLAATGRSTTAWASPSIARARPWSWAWRTWP